MDIKIELKRKISADVSAAQMAAVLGDPHATLKQFPKVKKLTALKDDAFRIDLKTIGSSVARVAHDVSFGADCSFDASNNSLSWEPVKSVGNALIRGELRFDKEHKSLILNVNGQLKGVPIPLMYRLVAPAFIQGKFSALSDAWLERLVAAAGARAAA